MQQNPQEAFQQEVQSRILTKVGELTAQNIELGAMSDAMSGRMAAMEQRGTALQRFVDDITASLAVRALTGQL